MPTVLLVAGFRFYFYSNEGNEPPHVHVEHAEGTAKFWLQPVFLVEEYDMQPLALRRARLLVTQHQKFFLEKWNDYFGT